jgi:hypothetical protein
MPEYTEVQVAGTRKNGTPVLRRGLQQPSLTRKGNENKGVRRRQAGAFGGRFDLRKGEGYA